MKQNSVEYNGYYYAAIDFTPPNAGGDPGGQKGPVKVPNGWEIAPVEEDVRENVIKTHTFGTCMVVGDGGKAIMTAKGARPGGMDMIWEYKKDMGMYKLHSSGNLQEKFGRIFIRMAAPSASA